MKDPNMLMPSPSRKQEENENTNVKKQGSSISPMKDARRTSKRRYFVPMGAINNEKHPEK